MRKESAILPFESNNFKQNNIKEEKESGTITTSIALLNDLNNYKDSPLDNLNKSSQKTEDTSNISKSTNEKDT